MRRLTIAASIVFIIIAVSAALADHSVFLREDFHSLENWRPLYFPKIKAPTQYSIEKEDNFSCLKAVSSSSASALVNKNEFNVYEFRRAKWKWKISNVYKKAVPGTKEGDDYPIRIYILFKYDPGRLGFFDKLKYNAAKLIYGEYPPDSTLSYVWASSPDTPLIMPSPYTDRARLVSLQRGPSKVGQWVDESVDILGDYRKAFGMDPPSTASIAIMNDSDNTGEKSVSYVGNLEVYQ